jgi:hypothetical protein
MAVAMNSWCSVSSVGRRIDRRRQALWKFRYRQAEAEKLLRCRFRPVWVTWADMASTRPTCTTVSCRSCCSFKSFKTHLGGGDSQLKSFVVENFGSLRVCFCS